RPQQLPGNAL
ncbi:hypothetical protein CP8484711_2000B, partial [Chlamydia psittaci 84-8471/1]